MDDAITYVGWALLIFGGWFVAAIGFGYVWHRHHERARKLFMGRRQTPKDNTPS